LGNKQIIFTINQIYINVNRHPDYIDECVPTEIDGLLIYKAGSKPSIEVRKRLLSKYHSGYHNAIASVNKLFILDGHSTVTGFRDASGEIVQDDIILSDFQNSNLDPLPGIKTAPDGFLESYANALTKLLPNLRISLNTTYCSTYGHIMSEHGWNGIGERKNKTPLILQETNEDIYIHNRVPDIKAIEELRRSFAQSLEVMLDKMQNFHEFK
jgi:hypothetical protein